MSVAEYRDKFAQLSCYASNEVANDADKQHRFLKGLYDGLQLQLMSNTYPNFQTLVNHAIVIDNKCKEMEALGTGLWKQYSSVHQPSARLPAEVLGTTQSVKSWSLPTAQPEPAAYTVLVAEWQSTSPAAEWPADTMTRNA